LFWADSLPATPLGSEGKMKNISVVIILFLLVVACSKNDIEYPNVDTKTISTHLKWDMTYNSVKKVLTDDFHLEFSKEIHQQNSEGLVYEFVGGKYHNFDTHSWVVAFVNDSLRMVSIKVGKDKPADNEIIYNQLIEQFNAELERDTVDVYGSTKWLLKNDDLIISEVTISMTTDKTGMAIFFNKK
jgi:hypothetical protein